MPTDASFAVPRRRVPLSEGGRFAARAGMLAVACLLALGLLASDALAAQPSVGLGKADSFGVLAGQAVSNSGSSTVNGDLGVSPGTAVTGFPPGRVNGRVHAGDALAGQAQSDLRAAYNDAAGRAPFVSEPGELGGLTLIPGVYRAASPPILLARPRALSGSPASTGSFDLTGVLTLDARGDPNAVFVFQAGFTLTTAAGSQVHLINGAQSCNVFWQIGSSATLGTSSLFAGNILAFTSISVNDGVIVNGRTLAQNGAVTLSNDTVSAGHCATRGGTNGGATGGGTNGGATGGGTTGGGTTGGGTTGGGTTGGGTTGGGTTGGGTTGGGMTLACSRKSARRAGGGKARIAVRRRRRGGSTPSHPRPGRRSPGAGNHAGKHQHAGKHGKAKRHRRRPKRRRVPRACAASRNAKKAPFTSPQRGTPNKHVAYGFADENATTFGPINHDKNRMALDRNRVALFAAVRKTLHVKYARRSVPYDVYDPSRCPTDKGGRPGACVGLADWLANVRHLRLTPVLSVAPHAKCDTRDPKNKVHKFNGTNHPYKADMPCFIPDAKQYQKYFRQLRKRTGVTQWVAWNEPDLVTDPTGYTPDQGISFPYAPLVADYWQGAQKVCPGCTIAAGELAFNNPKPDKSPPYLSRYASRLSRLKVRPKVWALHTYQEVTNRKGPAQSKFFIDDLAREGMGRPSIWITESGVELYKEAHKPADALGSGKRQVAAARRFLGLGSTPPVRQVTRVFYYLLSAGETPDFDSALLNPNNYPPGEKQPKPRSKQQLRRPADCVIEPIPHPARCPTTVAR